MVKKTIMANIYLKKIHGILAPADTEAEEIISKLKRGECICVKYTKPRNYKFHKKYFAMIKVMFDSQDFYNNETVFRKYLEMSAGLFETVLTPKGTILFWPKSISFADIDQNQFEKLYNNVITAFLDKFGSGLTREKLEEIVNFS